MVRRARRPLLLRVATGNPPARAELDLGSLENSRLRPAIGQTEGRRGHEDRGAGGGVEAPCGDDNDMQKLRRLERQAICQDGPCVCRGCVCLCGCMLMRGRTTLDDDLNLEPDIWGPHPRHTV